jgi:hypothetical protein
MVELQLPKLAAWVRFPSPAPYFKNKATKGKTKSLLLFPLLVIAEGLSKEWKRDIIKSFKKGGMKDVQKSTYSNCE